MPTPIKPRLATARPITEPPLNAAISADPVPPVAAAWAVRTLAKVAARSYLKAGKHRAKRTKNKRAGGLHAN